MNQQHLKVKNFYGIPEPTILLPHLILGSKYDLSDENFIKAFNIKYILCCATECVHRNFKIPKDVEDLKIKINDYTNKLDSENLLNFEKCVKFIEKSEPTKELKEGEKLANETCFVHCMRGRSRSASVIFAYLMKNQNLTLKESYEFVKEKRPFIGKKQMIF